MIEIFVMRKTTMAPAYDVRGWKQSKHQQQPKRTHEQQPTLKIPERKIMNNITNDSKILSFDLNCSDFVILNCDNFAGSRLFLLDTQADISVIKNTAIKTDSFINDNDIIKIRGITDGFVQTYGTINTDIILNDYAIPQEFHVVSDTFAIPSDGILGRDFIKNNKCQIDYKNMEISFNYYNQTFSLQILDSINSDTNVLPPRSEVFRNFVIKNFQNPQLIPNDEIANGIFIANTIAYDKIVTIRVLNTHDTTKVIPNTIINSENLSNYNIYNFDSINNSRNRQGKLNEIITNNSPKYIHKDLTNLCTKYSEIFAMESDTLTQNNFYSQKLRLTDNIPVYTKNYRTPITQKDEINKHVQELIDNELIEPSVSPYNSPVLLVPKKSNDNNKKWRMVIDYRQLNRKLIADKYPLPRIDEILDGLGNAKYFSILDLYSGFHQIKLEGSSREYTAFTTDQGTFQWKVLPFGLNIAPNSFCRMMALAFSGVTPQRAFMYMDDIIVIGSSERNHLQNLGKMFDICERYNLKLNPNKCSFFRAEVNFLGHKCTPDGVFPDNAKIQAIQNFPKPHDKDSVKRFAALTNYYRKFIQNYSLIVQPLNKLTRKRVPFEWSRECEGAFQELKSKLTKQPILKYPDFAKPFCVTVDASKSACGAVLSQNFDGEDLPISYISRSFQRAELNKSTIMKELLAIHYAVTYLRPYLYGRKFRVRSDHKPLVFLYNLKNPASKLTQIRLDLDEYDFDVEHIPGKSNVVADALSRISIDEIKNMEMELCDANINAITRSKTRKDQNYDIIDETLTKTNERVNIYVENNRKILKNKPEILINFMYNIRVESKVILKK